MSQSFVDCIANKAVEDSVWGERLANQVQWFGETTFLAYYTVLSVIFTILFIIWGFWRENVRDMSKIRIALLLWKLSILFFLFGAVVCGVTKFALALGILHNGCEFYMMFCILELLIPEMMKSKIKRNIIYAIGAAYFGLEFFLGLSLPLVTGYEVLLVMGVICDIVCYLLWILAYVKKKTEYWPMISFTFHVLYIVFYAANCAFAPWGRVIGIILNVAAVAFASVPIPVQHRAHNHQKMTDQKAPTDTKPRSVSIGSHTELMEAGESKGNSGGDSSDTDTEIV